MTSRMPRRNARGRAASGVPPGDSVVPPQHAPGDDGSDRDGAGTSASIPEQLGVGTTSTAEDMGSTVAQEIAGPEPDPDGTRDVSSKPATSVPDRLAAAVVALQHRQESDAQAARLREQEFMATMQQMLVAMVQVTASRWPAEER